MFYTIICTNDYNNNGIMHNNQFRASARYWDTEIQGYNQLNNKINYKWKSSITTRQRRSPNILL